MPYFTRKRKRFWIFVFCLSLTTVVVWGIYQNQEIEVIAPPISVIPPPPVLTPAVEPVAPPVIIAPPVAVRPVPLAPIIPPPPIKTKTLNYKFGISLGGLYSMNAKELDKKLSELTALGVGWVRLDIAWEEVQPKDSLHFEWSRLDRVVKALHAHNLKILPILGYTPKWARLPECATSDKCAPANVTQFGVFARETAKRYAPQGIHVWEIWNEPNLKAFWKPRADVSLYAKLLKESYVSIKSVDPSAMIITGGTGPSETKEGSIAPRDFLRQLYEQGARPYFDAVGHHPYSFPVTASRVESWSGWSQMVDTNPSLRSIMLANGDGEKKIWITEVGAPTGGPGAIATLDDFNFSQHPDHVTEELQVSIFKNALVQYEKYDWAGPLFWYTYKDLGVSKNTNENFFGLIRYNGSKKPAYEVFKSMIASSTPQK